MDLYNFPQKLRQYVQELLNRQVISPYSLEDKMFINYLFNLRIDDDYIISRQEL